MTKYEHQRNFDVPVTRFLQFSREDGMVAYLARVSSLSRREVYDLVTTDTEISWKVALGVDEQLPSGLKRILGDGNLNWVHNFVMNRETHHTTLSLEKTPISKYFDVNGEILINPRGEFGGTIEIRGKIESSIPMLGKSLEKMISKRVVDGWDKDFDHRIVYCKQRMQQCYIEGELAPGEAAWWEGEIAQKGTPELPSQTTVAD